MFAALIHEGEVVRLPSGRAGIVEGAAQDRVFGMYVDNGEEWEIRPKFLVHVSNKLSGDIAFLAVEVPSGEAG